MIPDVIHNLPDPELHCNATWPGVHPTPGFTTITTVPGCGLHREARASPHPPPCAGYRTGYNNNVTAPKRYVTFKGITLPLRNVVPAVGFYTTGCKCAPG